MLIVYESGQVTRPGRRNGNVSFDLRVATSAERLRKDEFPSPPKKRDFVPVKRNTVTFNMTAA